LLIAAEGDYLAFEAGLNRALPKGQSQATISLVTVYEQRN